YLAAEAGDAQGLGSKLHDLAMLLESYLEWLRVHNLQDADCLLDAAAQALRTDSTAGANQETIVEHLLTSRKPPAKARKLENKKQLEFTLTLDAPSSYSAGHAAAFADGEPIAKPIPEPRHSLGIDGLWVDGFSEWSAQELELLAALIPHCNH